MTIRPAALDLLSVNADLRLGCLHLAMVEDTEH